MKFFTQVIVLFILGSLHSWAVEDKETAYLYGRGWLSSIPRQ